MHKGTCLCGSISYEIDGKLGDFGYCHCTSCRKASGSAHGANSGVERSKFRLRDDPGDLKQFESSPGKFRAFCGNCGSPIYAYLSKTPELIRIRLGTLDTPFGKRAKAHTFVADKAAWDIIEGDTPQFDEWAPMEVLVQLGSRQK